MRSPWLIGLFHPLNIVMLAAAALAGLVAAWWLFPVGLVFWLVMVVSVARAPALRLNYQMETRAPVAGRFQSRLDKIQKAQVRLFNAMESASPEMRRLMQPVQDAIGKLTDQAYLLALRLTPQENYRITSNAASDMRNEIDTYTKAQTLTQDEPTRRKYQESIDAVNEKLARLQEVTTQLERADALLDSLANDLDVLLAEVSQIQSMDSKAASEGIPPLLSKLQTEANDLQAFGQNGKP